MWYVFGFFISYGGYLLYRQNLSIKDFAKLLEIENREKKLLLERIGFQRASIDNQAHQGLFTSKVLCCNSDYNTRRDSLAAKTWISDYSIPLDIDEKHFIIYKITKRGARRFLKHIEKSHFVEIIDPSLKSELFSWVDVRKQGNSGQFYEFYNNKHEGDSLCPGFVFEVNLYTKDNLGIIYVRNHSSDNDIYGNPHMHMFYFFKR